MSTHIHSAQEPAVAADVLAYGAVHLNVTDGGRALDFWHDIVGLCLIENAGEEVRLGVDGRELVVLHSGAERGLVPGHSGLYHLAIHLPDETELARVLWRLIVAGYPQAPTDHTMSKSTYLNDPDGLGLELVLETPERLGSWRNEAGGVELIDAEGNPHSIAEPLDVNDVLAHLPDRSFYQPLLPAGTKIGHVHLHVSELEPAFASTSTRRSSVLPISARVAAFRTGWRSTSGPAPAPRSRRAAARVCGASPSSFPARQRSTKCSVVSAKPGTSRSR
jgi:catechol 2,3-dioxygenase